MVVVDCCTEGEEVEAEFFTLEVGNVFACGLRTSGVMVWRILQAN